MNESERELAYYRAVEDLFAGLRGRPHVLSPRDFQLLRSWWREGIPLAAVTAGVTEVFARRREAGEEDPVVSLSYCRHAVRRATRDLAERRTGASGEAGDEAPETTAVIAALDRHLARAAAAQATTRPGVADCIESIRASLSELGKGDDPSAVEGALYSLETALLEGCWNALARAEQEDMEATARRAASGATGAAAERAVRAHRDRQLRILLGLPRLELP